MEFQKFAEIHKLVRLRGIVYESLNTLNRLEFRKESNNELKNCVNCKRRLLNFVDSFSNGYRNECSSKTHFFSYM